MTVILGISDTFVKIVNYEVIRGNVFWRFGVVLIIALAALVTGRIVQFVLNSYARRIATKKGERPLALVFKAIAKDTRCVVYPLDSNVVSAMPTKLDIHDSIICGTALVYSELLEEEVQVVSRDEEIVDSGLVKTLW